MAGQLAQALTAIGRRAAVLSLDDFYLRKSERAALARDVHLLLATRGVPGTHDIGLMRRTLARLHDRHRVAPTIVPAFDKIEDDRVPERECPHVQGPIDIVLVEGWCVGARAQPARDLVAPVNELERLEDPDGGWRGHVNQQLRGRYRRLFAKLDLCVLLCAPSFEIVHEWRAEQEAGLPSRSGAHSRMRGAELERFISHYERLTRWMHRSKPADLVIELDEKRVPRTWYPGARIPPVDRALR